MKYLDKWDYFPTIDDPKLGLMKDIEVIQEIDGLAHDLEELAASGQLLEMLDMSARFIDAEDSLDLDSVYISLIEAMPHYPPVELFEKSTQNTMIRRLRLRCFNSGLIKQSYNIPIFYKIAWNFFGDASVTNLSSFVLKTDLQNMNRHELELMLELTNIFPLEKYQINYVKLRL